ncbi:MAG: hypothetical protein CFE24_14300 [Flavobacterium sp. BFFFF2]|nr:MAG: hypothetical protein CFE24_14300 [Flavobacterium sp. BFFFF2]
MKIALISFVILLSTSCKKEDAKIKMVLPKSTEQEVEKNQLKMTDTTILLKNVPMSTKCKMITEFEAEKYLYEYFRATGALPRNEIKDNSKENLCIAYDTIYNLKLDKTCSAIIRYWLIPAGLNGSCVQPTMAIVSRTKKGFLITNKEFVNPDFGIDSISVDQTIYAYQFDCSEHKVLKNYKLHFELQ